VRHPRPAPNLAGNNPGGLPRLITLGRCVRVAPLLPKLLCRGTVNTYTPDVPKHSDKRRATWRRCWQRYYAAHKLEPEFIEKRRKRNRRLASLRRTWFRKLKESHPCLRCRERDIDLIEFHHRSSLGKLMAVSDMVVRAFSEKSILREIEKCDALCVRCHRKETIRQRMASVS
jgi:hypothetical protein